MTPIVFGICFVDVFQSVCVCVCIWADLLQQRMIRQVTAIVSDVCFVGVSVWVGVHLGDLPQQRIHDK